MTSMTRIRKPPRAPSGLRRQKRRRACAARGRTQVCRTGSTLAAASMYRATVLPTSRASASWIEHGVEQIHEEVHEDDDGDHEQVDALDHRVVALENGVEEEAAHARELEDGLDDDGPAEDLGEL